MDPAMKGRVAKVALDSAVVAIQNEYPTHRVQVITNETLQRQVRITDPTQTDGPRYFLIKVSEPF